MSDNWIGRIKLSGDDEVTLSTGFKAFELLRCDGAWYTAASVPNLALRLGEPSPGFVQVPTMTDPPLGGVTGQYRIIADSGAIETVSPEPTYDVLISGGGLVVDPLINQGPIVGSSMTVTDLTNTDGWVWLGTSAVLSNNNMKTQDGGVAGNDGTNLTIQNAIGCQGAMSSSSQFDTFTLNLTNAGLDPVKSYLVECVGTRNSTSRNGYWTIGGSTSTQFDFTANPPSVRSATRTGQQLIDNHVTCHAVTNFAYFSLVRIREV